ncbi:MAG TPA: hypothetical protein DCG23_01135, partial [Deltaproteobacteria bacterium]|nr:hypothetical protein [Deltaproteobacteria bacterium]
TFLNLRLVKILLCGFLSGALVWWIKGYFQFFEVHFLQRVVLLSFYLFSIAVCYFTLCVVFGERAVAKKAFSRFKGRNKR